MNYFEVEDLIFKYQSANGKDKKDKEKLLRSILQKYKEQQAVYGISTSPDILIIIENIEEVLENETTY